MRLGTSRLLFTENKNGSIKVEVVDFGVEVLGGHDWESSYDLTKENAAILFNELKKLHNGSFEQMLIAEFGEEFSTLKFEKFCKKHNISYSHYIWS